MKSGTFLLNINRLPVMESIQEISRCIGISSKRIYDYTNYTEYFYHSFDIKKKNGDFRKISAPFSGLKMVQKWILENILYKITLDTPSYGFMKNLTLPTKKNASVHKNNLFLLQTDIVDFFDNIDFWSVYNLYNKIGYNKEVCFVLTKLTTLNGRLPQGGVTSPYLSNLVCYRLDRRLSGLCQQRDITYSRYADDITMSSNNRNDLTKVYPFLSSIIEDEGFKLNIRKTRYSSHKKNITGLSIYNNKVLVPRKIKRVLRAQIHNSINNCNYDNEDNIIGYISYIESVENGYLIKVDNYVHKILEKTDESCNIAYSSSKLSKFLSK